MENRIWLKGDTHLHTCNSDGKLTPGQLVEACQQAGLDYAIITDHNYNTVKASYTDKNLLVMQGAGDHRRPGSHQCLGQKGAPRSDVYLKDHRGL